MAVCILEHELAIAPLGQSAAPVGDLVRDELVALANVPVLEANQSVARAVEAGAQVSRAMKSRMRLVIVSSP